MAFVDVATVPHIEWNFSDNSAEEEVRTNLEILRDAVTNSQVDLDSAIAALKNEITSASMPSTNVSYDYLTDDIETTQPDSKPDAPDFPSVSGVAKPQRGDLIDITLPVFPDVPTFDIDAPTDTFDYTETQYESDILTALKNHVLQWLNNGGIEMDSIIQNAVDATFTRARARLEEVYSEQYDIALSQTTSRGWSLHNGAESAIIQKVNNEHTRRVEDLNSEITAKENEFKIRNREFLLTMAKDLETVLMDHADKVANRTFEAAKTTVTLLYDIYKSKVEAYVARIQGVSTEIGAKTKIVDAQIGINKGISEIFGIDTERYRTEIKAITDVIDGQAKVYAAQIGGYEADINWAGKVMTARVEKLKSLISQSTNQTELQVKEAEVNLQAYINSLGLNIEVSKAIANLLTQVVASSLGALNTHVSMSDGTSRGFSSSYSHGESIGNTKSLGESHSYDETK